MWLHAKGSTGAFLRGVEPAYESEVSDVADSMLAGQLTDLKAGGYGIVLGVGLASKLRVGLGDKVTVIAPRLKVSPFGANPMMRRFTVIGAFELGEYETDSGLAIIHIDDAGHSSSKSSSSAPNERDPTPEQILS